MYRREVISATHGPVVLRMSQLPRELQLGLVSGPETSGPMYGYIMFKETSTFI
jgi:hypothetical protein